MRVRLASVAFFAVASPALAQDSFARPLSTHDELFGTQLELDPSPRVPRTVEVIAGRKLNPALGGPGSVPLGGIVTKRISPADTTQNDVGPVASHDDLQYSPQ
jgi:hypothetical protein